MEKVRNFFETSHPCVTCFVSCIMSERPRRTTRAPAKTPLELTTPSKRVKRKAVEVVDPAESLRVLLQSPKSLLTTTNISVCVLIHFLSLVAKCSLGYYKRLNVDAPLS